MHASPPPPGQKTGPDQGGRVSRRQWLSGLCALPVVLAGCGPGGVLPEADLFAPGPVWDPVPLPAGANGAAPGLPPASSPPGVAPPPGGFAPPGRARVRLTYDDGPHPEWTPRILDILAAHGAKATFFVVGRNVARYPHVVRRIVQEGHAVGNHSYTHPSFPGLSPAMRAQEIRQTQEAVAAASGAWPSLFRPPYGATSEEIRAQVEGELGLRQVLWDRDTLDYQKPGVQVVADRVVAAPVGSVVLLHDIHATTAAATAVFVPRIT